MAQKGKSTIMKFRQDRRLMVVGAFQSLALLGLLATLIFCVYNYSEDLNMQNARRIYAYLNSATKEDGDFTGYQFETGVNVVCAPFAAGLAVFSGDTYRYITTISAGTFSQQLKYSRPAISAGEKYVLLYDRGGKGFCVANTYATLKNETLESPIISGEMGLDGSFCLVTDEAGFRAGVTMYNAKQKEMYKWQTSSYYVMLASPAPNGKSFAALCLNEKDGETVFTVKGFDIKKEDPVFEIDLGTSTVYSLKHYSNGNLVIICNDGIYIYNQDGEKTGELIYPSGALTTFVHKQGQMPVLVLSPKGTGTGFDLTAVNPDGTAGFSQAFSGTLRALDYYNGTAAMLFQSQLTAIDILAEKPTAVTLPSGGARDVLVRRDKRPVLIYSDRAEPVDLTAEPTTEPTTEPAAAP